MNIWDAIKERNSQEEVLTRAILTYLFFVLPADYNIKYYYLFVIVLLNIHADFEQKIFFHYHPKKYN